MKKKWLALLLAAGLVLSLAACRSNEPATSPSDTPDVTDPASPEVSAPSTDPLEMITEGYYQHSFSVEGYGEFCHYFHFYEEDPVLGAVFYAGLNNGRSTFVGTYKVEEAPFDYACYPDRATKEDSSKEPTEGTAPYTVTFFDWDGNEIGKVGYDGDILYNVMDEEDVIYAQGSGTVNYLHDVTGEKASYYENELGVPYLDYVADDEVTSTLQICHNKTYVDLVGAMIEGTWTVAENADGGLDFTLTPDDGSDTGAVVSTSADKKTCTYTPDGGEAVAMSAVSAGNKALYTFAGTHHIEAHNMDADVILEVYEDNTCKAAMSLQGSSIDLASGTYELSGGYKFHFVFDNGQEADSNVDASGTMTVQLVVAGTQVGDVDTTLTLVKDEPQIAYTFTGTHHIEAYNMDAEVVLELYDNNTCKAAMSVKDSSTDLTTGTYELDGHTFHFSFDSAEDADSSVDGSGTVTVQLVVAGTEVGDVDTTLTLQR